MILMLSLSVKQITGSHPDLVLDENQCRCTGHLVRLDDRKSKVFGEISDGTCVDTLKFIYFGKKTESPQCIVQLREAPVGSSVTIIGQLKQAPSSASQQWELHVESAVVHSKVRDPTTYPYGLKAHKKRQGAELIQHLASIRSDTYTRFRDKTFLAIMRLRGVIYTQLVDFFSSQGFTKIDAPILTTSDCEGAGEMFNVTTFDLAKVPVVVVDGKPVVVYSEDFFNEAMHLTVSGQLEVEAAARELMKVFTFGRTFRAEHSKTRRHLAEFEMLEPEMVFTDPDENTRFHQLMDLKESMLKHVISYILEHHLSDLTYLDNALESGVVDKMRRYLDVSYERITYTQAVELLKQYVVNGGVFDDKCLYWGMDLTSEHEQYLCEQVFNKPIFVTHYPQDLKSFYMKADKGCADDMLTCQAVDLLVPGVGELCGGSMREDCPEQLEAVMNKKGIGRKGLQWYIDLRRDGGLPTGGFGLGFARLVSFITGVPHVRDVVPFPRTYDV